jgi:hypothetical protein
MRSLQLFCLAALACLSSACASMSLPSLSNDGESPRRTTSGAIELTIGVLRDLDTAAGAGMLSDNFLDDVVQFAPVLTERATVYLDNTAACVAIGGVLQSDPATGRACQKSEISRAFGSLKDILYAASDLAYSQGDTNTGRTIGLAAVLLRRQLEPSAGDVFDGYDTREDLTLAEFDSARAALRAAMEQLVATAQKQLDAGAGAPAGLPAS